MGTFLDYLGLCLGLCAVMAWCVGAYHDFKFKDGWRREWMDGRGQWGLFNINIVPEPYRTHRRRSFQMMLVFFGIVGLMCLVFYIKSTAFPT